MNNKQQTIGDKQIIGKCNLKKYYKVMGIGGDRPNL
jgi:hypothetical protein